MRAPIRDVSWLAVVEQQKPDFHTRNRIGTDFYRYLLFIINETQCHRRRGRHRCKPKLKVNRRKDGLSHVKPHAGQCAST